MEKWKPLPTSPHLRLRLSNSRRRRQPMPRSRASRSLHTARAPSRRRSPLSQQAVWYRRLIAPSATTEILPALVVAIVPILAAWPHQEFFPNVLHVHWHSLRQSPQTTNVHAPAPIELPPAENAQRKRKG